MSCKDCVFKGIFQDMGASSDVCNLQSNLVDAIKACENSADCRYRFTVQEAKSIVIEREGGLPVITREETKSSEVENPLKTISDALKEVGESACKAINSLRKRLQGLATESEDTEADNEQCGN